ncbi:MAG: hypothetical protein WC862_02555 [Patescibacteria group bacterium]
MLGERATTEIHRNESSQGVPKLKSDAKAGRLEKSKEEFTSLSMAILKVLAAY